MGVNGCGVTYWWCWFGVDICVVGYLVGCWFLDTWIGLAGLLLFVGYYLVLVVGVCCGLWRGLGVVWLLGLVVKLLDELQNWVGC